jgi:hypothetical protein
MWDGGGFQWSRSDFRRAYYSVKPDVKRSVGQSWTILRRTPSPPELIDLSIFIDSLPRCPWPFDRALAEITRCVGVPRGAQVTFDTSARAARQNSPSADDGKQLPDAACARCSEPVPLQTAPEHSRVSPGVRARSAPGGRGALMAPAEPTLSALARRLRERATGRPHAHSSQTDPPDAIWTQA